MDSRQDDEVEEVPLLDGERSSDLEEFDYEEKPIPSRHYRPWTQWAATVINIGLLRLPEWNIQHFSLGMAMQYVLKFLVFLIPSFLRHNPDRNKPLHETAYLDGMRGFACYCVFFSHHTSAFALEVLHPYGEGPNLHFVKTDFWWQMPIIRLLYNGQAAIGVFFVLSGYVLSYKPLKLIHARDYEGLQKCLASSIFRRWLRLFLPVAALWIVNVLLVELGAFDWWTAFRIANPKVPNGLIENYLTRGDSFWGTANNAYKSYKELFRYSLFRWTGTGYLPEVDGHIWTLHVEFRSSCILFLFLHGTSFVQPNIRLAFTLLSTAVCHICDQWSIATFLAGSAIADLDLRRRRSQAQHPLTNGHSEAGLLAPRKTSLSSLQTWFWSNYDQLLWGLVFFAGLILLSYPILGAGAVFFYRTILAHFKPAHVFDLFFFSAIGAMLLVYAAGRVRIVQRVLEWRFSQYIGKTSFALYLVHGTVIKSLGNFVVIQTWKHITGRKGWWNGAGILLPLLLVVGPVTIVAADWFWRGIDKPSVRFARWLESVVKDK